MAFVSQFTVTQGADCSQFTVNDVSVYTTEGTGTFSSRKLSIQKSDGSYLKIGSITYQNYVWAFASGNSITFFGLDSDNLPYIDQDYSFLITLTHTSTSPQPGSVYSAVNAAVLVCYTLSGFYTFSYKMSINPSLEKDYKFVKDLMRLFIEQESAKKASLDGDFQASQGCLDRAKFIIDNLTVGY